MTLVDPNIPTIAPVPPQLLLKAPEAAKALGIGIRLLWEKTKSGEIPCVRIGRRVLYPVDLLQKFIGENTKGGGK